MFIELQQTAFTRQIQCNKGTTFQLIGTLGVGESITFEQPDGAGSWFTTKINATEVALTADNTMISVAYPALIRVNKPITVADAGVRVVS